MENIIKPQSAKAKGRKLQQWMRDKLIELLDIHPENVKSTSMGAGGEDVIMSKEARDAFPYSIECKCQESLNIWKAYDQASANCGKHEPLVIIKRNRSKTLAVVEAEYFIKLHKD